MRWSLKRLQSFLDFVLAQYVKQGVGELDQDKLGALIQLRCHTKASGECAADRWVLRCRRVGAVHSINRVVFTSADDFRSPPGHWWDWLSGRQRMPPSRIESGRCIGRQRAMPQGQRWADLC
jgi:hypothetical protein